MLPQDNRLAAKTDIDKVKKRGKLINCDSFSLCYLKTDEKQPSRFAFIISNKISKSAAIRNKSKRALREAVRHNISYMKTGYDILFLTKPIIIKKYTDEIMREVSSALEKNGFFK